MGSTAISTFIETLELRRLLTAAADVLSYRNDAGSTGQNLNEAVLKLSNVNSTSFGKRFTTALDGQVYAQPLCKTNVNITRGTNQGIHDVIYAATQHDSLYAIDANSGTILWQDSFLNVTDPTNLTPTSGVSPIGANLTVPNNGLIGSDDVVSANEISPEVGIVGTPVIDPNTNILYLVAATKEYRRSGADRHFVQRLWAVNISDGTAALGGPAVIGDTVKNTTIGAALSQYGDYQYFAGPVINGTGNNAPVNDSANHLNTNADGWIASTDPNHLGYIPSSVHQIAFNALLQMTRPAVTLVNGTIYLAFASHGDNGPFYGWVLGYNASTLALGAAFVTCPTFENIVGNRSDFRSQAGIWMSGDGIASDPQGNLYLTTGNGIFDTAAANFDASGFPIDHDYGDCLLKLAVDPSSSPSNQNGNGWGLSVADYFAPSNAVRMNQLDADLGSGGVMVLPDGAGNLPGHPHLAIAGSKESRIYLFDRDNLGKFNTAYNAQPVNTDPRSFDRVVGEYSVNQTVNNMAHQAFSTPAYFSGNGQFYYALTGWAGLAWTVSGFPPVSGAIPPGNYIANPVQNTATSITSFGNRGSTFSVSANGNNDGIVWGLINQNATGTGGTVLTDGLVALSATNFTTTLFNSGNGSNSLISAGGGTTGVKFSVPTIANGLVYCATGGTNSSNAADGLGSIVAYGLINPNLTAPTGLTGGRTIAGVNHLTWTDRSADESFFQIERSLDGATGWTVIGFVGNGTISYDDSTIAPATDYSYRVKPINGPGSGSYSNVATIIAPPGVTASSFTWQNAPQRLSFTFDQDVSTSLSSADLLLQNLTTSTNIPTGSILTNWDTATKTVTFTFSTQSSGALPDGKYVATLVASGITNSSDVAMTSDYVTTFFFLNGDANHDGAVDVTDLGILATHWQTSAPFSAGDFNYDGFVDVTDLGILATDWQNSLPPPLPAAPIFAQPVHMALKRASSSPRATDVIDGPEM